MKHCLYLVMHLKVKKKKVKVISLEIDEKEVLNRLSSRRVCEKCGKEYNVVSLPPKTPNICNICGSKLVQREDDKEEIIKKRLEIYWKQTSPLTDYYKKKGIIMTIDGKGSIPEVSNRLFNTISARAIE